MSVKSVDKDLDALTLTLVAEFSATTEQVWELWANPRKLEQWWGPPTYPATVVEHDLTPGGEVTYYMTGPEGDQHHAWWRFIAVNEPKSLEFVDGFADADGNPVDTMPTNTTTVTFSPYDGGTRMELRSVFDTTEQMEKLISMGMDEGLTLSVGQMDALLAS
ncbi:SRPBCC domain-containing protein [Kribbella antibiotica]|uniref:SRPBCC domain-containing protein n=1 Tax=Kribbella antibiotica TaxID=190195 RepID=A0A4R4ZWW4_9ACTN|nr:SRPBCC domain-containing protein [Kribbella antibiotica]TDD63070.1 SRPBCC domain-containing protein [Kribbella antibiotica]